MNNIEKQVKIFFAGTPYERIILDGIYQDMDLEKFVGRISSVSAAIQPNESGYEAFLEKIQALFMRHQQNGLVRLSYDTEIYLGQIG